MDATPTPAADSTSKSLSLKEIDKHVKLAVLSSIAAAVISSVITLIGSHYQTKATLQDLTKTDITHTEQISKLADGVSNLSERINEINTKTAVISTAPDNLNKQIQDLNARMARVENQQDKMYDILIDLSKRK